MNPPEGSSGGVTQSSYPSIDPKQNSVTTTTGAGSGDGDGGGAGEPGPLLIDLVSEVEKVDDPKKPIDPNSNQSNLDDESRFPQILTYTFEGINCDKMGNNLPLLCHRTVKAGFPAGHSSVKDLQEECCPQSSFVNLYCLLCGALVTLVLIQTTIVGYWIRLFDLVHTSMPHTFSWLSILSCYGAVYEFKKCGHDPSYLCDLDYSLPYLPIIGITVCSIQLVMTLLFLFFKNCRKPFLFYLKQMIFLQGLLLIFGGVVAGAFLYRDLSGLKGLMKREMGQQNQSVRWERTQMINHCCGMENVTDWIFGTKVDLRKRREVVPKSCCLTPSCDKSVVNSPGCYNLEYQTVLFYGKTEIFMMLTGFLLSIAVLVMAKKFYRSCKQNKKMLEQTNSNRILIRQGSNCTVFGGQSGNGGRMHIIRRNGILIEAKGVLASSTSINNDELSLEILNFSHEDKVTVSRELDRIMVTVLRRELVRGKVVVTAIDEENLEKVRVTPSSTGVLYLTL